SLADRVEAWRELSGDEIRAFVGSIEDAEFLDGVLAALRPEAIVHYGEQPSAPYSMRSRAAAIETQQTNVIGTLNLLHSIRHPLPVYDVAGHSRCFLNIRGPLQCVELAGTHPP